MEHDTYKAITLRVYRLPGELWGGRLFAGEEEIGVLGAFPSEHEVQRAAAEAGMYPDHIEMDAG